MISIFAHRALLNAEENTIQGISNCIKQNISVELDLRFDGYVYMSHDPTTNGELFENACKIIQNSNTTISLHIKEISALAQTVKFLKKYNLIKKCFIFMTTIDYNKVRSLTDGDIHVAFYACEKPIHTNAKFLWCDETKEKWYDKVTISNLQKEGKKLIAMSPELLGSKSMNEIKHEWRYLINLGFDGICTDHPLNLLEFQRNV